MATVTWQDYFAHLERPNDAHSHTEWIEKILVEKLRSRLAVFSVLKSFGPRGGCWVKNGSKLNS
jgi:hypothetical protein